MRPLKSLTFESVVEVLRSRFNGVGAGGDPHRAQYPVRDILLSGFAMFFFQDPSLLQFQERLVKKKGRCNLQTMFGVSAVPGETQMRERLDEVEAEEVRVLLPHFFELIRRAGSASHYRSPISSGRDTGEYYVAALDGTDYFHSTAINCPQCLTRADANGEPHYRHTVVAATIVTAGSHRILPFDAEMCQSADGSEKQDCELQASKRLLKRIRREHRQVPLIVTGDDLYSHVPFIEECAQQRLHYVLVAKPTSHKELWEWVEELAALGESERVEWRVGPACSRKFYEARIVRAVPLRADAAVEANFLEVWERNKKGELVYHNSWVTDVEVTRENVSEIVLIGGAKWKVENEQFNVQKNHGYHLQHNYGHGKQNLSAVFYYLNLLAYLTHIILDRGDRLFQQCRQVISRREEMWNVIRTMMNFVVWLSWKAMLEYILDDELRPLPP